MADTEIKDNDCPETLGEEIIKEAIKSCNKKGIAKGLTIALVIIDFAYNSTLRDWELMTPQQKREFAEGFLE